MTPGLEHVRERAVTTLKADADRFAKNVVPIIFMRAVLPHRGIARSLNARGVATARGGRVRSCDVLRCKQVGRLNDTSSPT
jgi:hypothetical protein